MLDNFIKKYVKILVALGVIAGSSSGIFASVIEAPSMAIGFWRLTLAMPFFALPVLIRDRESLKNIDRKSLGFTFLAGIFLFGHFLTWFTAVKLTNISSAVTLSALHPLVVLFITIFIMKKKVNFRSILGIGLAIVGGAMIAGFDFQNLYDGRFTGDMLAFATAICMGLYFVMGDFGREKIKGSVYVFLLFFVTWICFIIGCLATKTPVLGYSTSDYIYLVGMTLVCQIGAHAVFNLCLGHVDSLYVSTWESGEAISATILGIVFLGQIPTMYNLACCLVVVAGLFYYNYGNYLQEEGKK